MSTVIQKQQAKQNLAANLERLLESREMEQIQLAKLAGEKPMMISRAVRGKHMPAGDVLHRIAEALDVSVDRLLDAPPENSQENPVILQKTT